MAEPRIGERALRVGSSIKAFVGSKTMIALVTVAISSLIIAYAVLPQSVVLEAGQFAKRDIESPRTIVNRVATDKLKEDARKAYMKSAPNSPENYEISQSYSYMAEESVDAVFDAVVTARADDPEAGPEAIARAAAKKLGGAVDALSLSAGDLAALAQITEDELASARQTAASLVGRTMRDIRITDASLQKVAAGIPDDLTRDGLPPQLVKAVSRVVVGALRPNLSLDLAKVEKAAEDQSNLVPPVYIQKGQSIIRRGDAATEEHIAILSDLGLLGSRGSIMGWIGVVCLTAMAVAYTAAYVHRFTTRLSSAESSLALCAVAGVAVLISASVLAGLAPDYAPYLVPAAFASMIISSLLSLEMAMAVNLSVAALVGVMLRGDAFAMLAALAAGAAGAYSVPGLRDRASMTRAVVFVGGAVAAVSVCYGLAFGEPQVLSRWYWGFVNGMISTVLTLGSLPFFESIFGVTSPLRLLELSNPGHPLLRRLLLEAPGTYHHSILVGNLAETAAQAVGADALLVRVGALYHDVGKLKRPYFFVENQFAQANPHDKISPALSTLVITSHAKDGVELARQYRLPKSVIDLIQQHHGTGLVSFFYQRAAENDRDQSVDEKDFRYPGPRPQSREAAIVMLADSVEAAVRAQSDASPWQVQSTVKKVVRGKLADGQLDECDLTLKDLYAIENAFLDVLSGVYHERVEYPDLRAVEAGAGADANGSGNANGSSHAKLAAPACEGRGDGEGEATDVRRDSEQAD